MRQTELSVFFAVFLSAITAYSQETDCVNCHGRLAKEKVVHAAVSMGCGSCHTGIDAGIVPHKKTGGFSKGLSSDPPELCYGCHDKSGFEKKNVHAAVGMGCTGCHNPHSSKNERLLVSLVPDLCFTCHDKSGFAGKTVHVPVAGGMCLGCHSPHSSDEYALLLKKTIDLCLDCHPNTAKKPHAVAGFSSQGHPTGLVQEKAKELKDPVRPERPFSCASCHAPHSSAGPRLFRFNARSSMELCTKCHRM